MATPSKHQTSGGIRLDVFRDTCRENRDVLPHLFCRHLGSNPFPLGVTGGCRDCSSKELKKLAVELTEQLDQVGNDDDDEYKYEYEFNDLLHHAVSHNHLTTTKTQEYTALMASIEEIQALMEAEVAGGSFWFLNEVTD